MGTRRALPAGAPDAAHAPSDRDALAAGGIDYTAFDHLATLVAVVEPDGKCVFANSVLEAVVGVGRRKLCLLYTSPSPRDS